MNIAILGAGAMGCLYASMLVNRHNVTLFDSYEPTVNAIEKGGITVCEKSGEEHNCKVKIIESGSCRNSFDMLIVFVKDMVTESALQANSRLIGSETVVLSLQNGIGNQQILEKYTDGKNILLGTSKHNSVVLEPGKIFHSGNGVTNIGSPVGNHTLAMKIVEEFSASGIETEFCGNVNRLLWEKLFINMTINTITAILDTKIEFVSENKYAKDIMISLVKEAVAVAAADGVPFDVEERTDAVLHVCESLRGGTASMCQDIERKRRTEIDFINGAVSRLGRKYSVPTPTHDALISLIHAKESTFMSL